MATVLFAAAVLVLVERKRLQVFNDAAVGGVFVAAGRHGRLFSLRYGRVGEVTLGALERIVLVNVVGDHFNNVLTLEEARVDLGAHGQAAAVDDDLALGVDAVAAVKEDVEARRERMEDPVVGLV